MNKEVFLVKIGNRIRQVRIEKGISQAELARRTFKDRQAIERIENAKINPSIYILYQIAQALEVEVKVLVDIGKAGD